MRVVLSLGVLLLVLLVVSKLAGLQLRALVPAGGSGTAARDAAMPPPGAAASAAAQMIHSVRQGAAQRAEDGASR